MDRRSISDINMRNNVSPGRGSLVDPSEDTASD